LYNFLYGNLRLGNFQKGITLAASWAWGVSIIVGMQIFQTKGIESFAIWAAANSLTLALLGWIFTKVPAEVSMLSELMPAWGIPIYSALTYAIQFFSVLVNITAIKTAFKMLGFVDYWPVFVALVFAGVFLWGFSHAVKGNIVKYSLWMALLLYVLWVPAQVRLIQSTTADINFALYGALILFCAPVLDQQMWQRRKAFGAGIKPFLWASGLFALYMVMVGLAAAVGVGGYTVSLVILLVAGSTLASALSAISCYHKTKNSARVGMVLVFFLAATCTIFNLSVIQIWVLYGSLRIPFALFAFYRILSRKS